MNYTTRQIADWRAFEKVRQGGKYNMFDSRAHDSAGLRRDEALFVMGHYEALRMIAEYLEEEEVK